MWLYTSIDVLLLMETVPVEAGIEIWFVLLDVEVGLDTAGELLQPMGLDTVVEPSAECSLLDVEMRRWLGSLSLSSAEDYVSIFSFGLDHHLGSHSLGLFHD